MYLLNRPILFGIAFLLGLSACGGGGGGGGDDNEPDTTAPAARSTVPADGATGVKLGAIVSATFDEGILSSSVSGASFTLDPGSKDLSGTVVFNRPASPRSAAR